MMRVRLLGVPVAADWWFLLGLALIAQMSGGGRAGVIAAIAAGVLVVVHELGHALVARRAGCEVSVRLNLLVGWASYSAPKPLSRSQRVAISLAGPFAQLAAAVPLLWLVHGPASDALRARIPGDPVPFSVQLWIGLVWAGVVLALLNLLPLWPLDGGHVVQQVLARRVGDDRAARLIAASTLAVCGVLVVAWIGASRGVGVFVREQERASFAVVDALTRSFPGALWAQVRALPGLMVGGPLLLLLFCGTASWAVLRGGPRALPGQALAGQALRQGRAAAPRLAHAPAPDPLAVVADHAGWAYGAAAQYPDGWTASPWLRAHLALRRGDYTGAQAALAELGRPGGQWVAPNPRRPELAPLVGVLPDPFPSDDPSRAAEVLDVLAHHGAAAPLLHLANALYERVPDPEVLYRAASGLGRRGLASESITWLRRAAMERPDRERVLTDDGFVPLHGHPEFQQLLDSLVAQPVR